MTSLARFPAAAAAVFLAAAGCAASCRGSAEAEDPCQEQHCSPHGRCEIGAGGEPVCVCDPGFEADGLTCAADSVVDPCAGVPCSGHGTCVLDAAREPSCRCDPGYRAEWLTCVDEPVVVSGRVAHWKADEGAGTLAADSSGGGHAATLHGGATWAAGRLGGALHFDGQTGYADTGFDVHLPSWSVALWAMGDRAPSGDLNSDTGPVQMGANILIGWDHVSPDYRGAAALMVGDTWYSASFGPLEGSRWYHLTATYDGSRLLAYRDGQLVTATATSGGPAAAEPSSMKLGRHAFLEQYFAGTVDDVQVYDRALSAADVAQLYGGGVCPAGQTACGADCADLQRDASHCGVCERACGAGQSCGGGVCTTPAIFGLELFVAPSGSDDTGDGSASRPFATPERAQTFVRASKAGAGLPANGVAVTFRAGTYRRTGSLVFTAGDSGAATAPVVWRAQPGETVRFSGGQPISGWTPVGSADPNWPRVKVAQGVLFRAAIIDKSGPALIDSFVERANGTPLHGSSCCPMKPAASSGCAASAGFACLPFNGWTNAEDVPPKLGELIFRQKMMTLARYPKRFDDGSQPARVGASWLGVASGSGTAFESVESIAGRGWAEVASLAEANKPWVHEISGYADNTMKMTGASDRAIGISLAPVDDYGGARGRWAALNLLEEVREPGDYWIDRAASPASVYFYPPSGEDAASLDAAEAEVSMLQATLLTIEPNAEYLVFEGISFEAAQGQLVIDHGKHNTFRSCLFRNAGGWAGLVASGDSLLVSNSEFYDLIGSGIVLSGRDLPGSDRLGARNAVIEHSEIHHVARYTSQRVPALTVSGWGHRVSNNDVHDIAGMGIYHQGYDCLFEKNRFRHVGLHGCDHGAFYAWGNEGMSTVVRWNLFRDGEMNRTYNAPVDCFIVAAIYSDDYSRGLTAYGNIIDRYLPPQSTAGNPGHPGGVGLLSKSVPGPGQNVFRHNVVSNSGDVWETSWGVSGHEDLGEGATANQAWNNRDPRYDAPGSYAGWPPNSTNNLDNLDPGYLDAPNGNFANRDDGTLVLSDQLGTPAAERTIPFREIGRNP